MQMTILCAILPYLLILRLFQKLLFLFQITKGFKSMLLKLSNSMINYSSMNVLYIPSFNCNLLSISRLISNKEVCFVFLVDICFIQALSTWKTIGWANKKNGLFYLKQQAQISSTVCSAIFLLQ